MSVINKTTYVLLLAVLIILSLQTVYGQEVHFKDTYAKFDGKNLIVATSFIKREWKLLSHGLAATYVHNLKSGKKWGSRNNTICEWDYKNLISSDTKAKLVSFNAVEDDDCGFSDSHLKVELEFFYKEIETYLKYEIRAYPQAEGLYTRISLKGNPGKYSTGSGKENIVSFIQKSGKAKFDYAANGKVKDYIASFAYDSKKVEYHIIGLDRQKRYTVGLTWWGFGDANLVQNLKVTSVDGEVLHEIFKNHKVPSEKDGGVPETLKFELPADVLLDGSFRLIIDKVSGSLSTLSEIWIEEASQKQYFVQGNIDRVSKLAEGAGKGNVLMAYMDCGAKMRGSVDDVSGRTGFIPVDASLLQRRYAGYYNDTQHRNTRETPLLRETVITQKVNEKEYNSWANVLFVEDSKDALIMVKESHKCVNQYGYDTGDFIIEKRGISNTGTSLLPHEILLDKYRHAWASWVIVGENSEDGREYALKSFERKRFPVNLSTDVYIMANTWGSDRGVEASTEGNVLKEMPIQKSLGIDVQQIDDGYQKPKTKNGKQNGWYPHPDRYPEGFVNVKRKAEELNLKLGLWYAAMQVSLKEMKDNYDAAGFSFYKLDFAYLRNHSNIEQMIEKIRAYELYTNHKSKVNWDVTENAPRFGFFWAKEYGCVFLENRKPKFPENVVYVPYLVLRDLWHLSKYCNLNKFQGLVQNKDMVDKERSDAYKYSHAYTTAISLMSTPLFFQETQFYSQEALDEIKEVLSAYKKERKSIYQCLVYPIGNEPNNASWTGFQAYNKNTNTGYLNLFREIDNPDKSFSYKLRFLSDCTIKITNLMTGKIFEKEVDKNGNVNFTIENPGEFRMLKYEVK